MELLLKYVVLWIKQLMEKIQIQPILPEEFPTLINFDNTYFRELIKGISLPISAMPVSFTLEELAAAFQNNNPLAWIFINKEPVGYFWFEPQISALHISGLVIKPNFYGLGISQYILDLAEKIAKEQFLKCCRLKVMPLNGRAVHAYLKCGYQITNYSDCVYDSHHLVSLRFIMEKAFTKRETNFLIDECEINCSDYEKLKDIIDRKYVGTGLIRASNNNSLENKLRFELKDIKKSCTPSCLKGP